MSKYKELAGQTLVYGLGTIVPRLLNFLLLTPFYTYIFFEQEKYGVITELYSYTAFLLVILTYGFETTYFRFSTTHNPRKVFNNTLSLHLISSLLFITAIFFYYQEIADILEYSNQSYLIIVFSSIVFFDVITSIPFAYLRNEKRAFYFSFIKLGSVVINVFFNIFFLVICRNSENHFLGQFYNPSIGVGYAFISNLIGSIFSFLALLPVYVKFRFYINWQLTKKLFNYALPLLIVGIAGMINEVADKLFLRHLLSDADNPLKVLGIYGANYKMAVLMTIFIQMFKYAAEPFFFKNSDSSDAKIVYKNVLDYFIVFCLFIFLLVCLYIDVFKYFIGSTYREALDIVPIILLANLFLGIYYNLSIWYKVTDNTRYGGYISLVGVMVTLFINLKFIPVYGYYACAWATFLCYGTMMVISYFLGQKFYPIYYNIKKLSLYFLLTVTIYLIHIFVSFELIVLDHLFSTFLMISFIVIILKINRLDWKKLKHIFIHNEN